MRPVRSCCLFSMSVEAAVRVVIAMTDVLKPARRASDEPGSSRWKQRVTAVAGRFVPSERI